MNNFTFHNPVRVYFGDDKLQELPDLVKEFGSKVLLVYGKSSIKRMGLYDKVVDLLQSNNIDIVELSGIDPNPRIESVREGGELCKKHDIDLVLAVGGGSVIDAAKGIASAALYDGDPWDFYSYKVQSEGALPIGTILTLSATGSEMNRGSVVTNLKTKQKHGWGSPYTYPKFSILDPRNTFTVNQHQTGCGIVDSLTHVYEFYFSKNDNYLNNRICEAIMKTVIHYGPQAIDNPENYEARANLMFGSTLALNGLTGFSNTWDGFNHTTEHVLSAYYDIAHADGLAILGPHWMNYILDESNVQKFKEFAINVWEVEDRGTDMEIAKRGIQAVFDFYQSIHMPTQLSNVNIDDKEFDEIASYATRYGESVGRFKELSKDDVLQILINAK
ncbi:iron-containing alcohol dehydrogenase [Candidatus Xianfuyuplasma coldseepsis]|uniref:Iron-containing alcohol dehydrogenase n=1 Tax=Candidatus Xianfuyuplasma coldseepsis TaxID=2782163 RepID=A0A7L7KSS8_9MOLU|nr:iron-containing alcohol dehydrogenase [Xianfuyuplasma coldseepsis]QMS85871.1 iron-containing alcohol dehydrogenase [Xianfuyuplasma coldseepsis]